VNITVWKKNMPVFFLPFSFFFVSPLTGGKQKNGGKTGETKKGHAFLNKTKTINEIQRRYAVR
jgi:hypothetical protein